MPRTEISLDDLLAAQAARGALATVEAAPGDGAEVVVTPWTDGAGCGCDSAITVPRSAIATLTTTDATHPCCGKLLTVVEVTFADEVLGSVFAQLARRSRGPGGGRAAAPTRPAVRAVAGRAPGRRDPGGEIDPVAVGLEMARQRYESCMASARDDFDRCLCDNAFSSELFALGLGGGAQITCPPPG